MRGCGEAVGGQGQGRCRWGWEAAPGEGAHGVGAVARREGEGPGSRGRCCRAGEAPLRRVGGGGGGSAGGTREEASGRAGRLAGAFRAAPRGWAGARAAGGGRGPGEPRPLRGRIRAPSRCAGTWLRLPPFHRLLKWRRCRDSRERPPERGRHPGGGGGGGRPGGSAPVPGPSTLPFPLPRAPLGATGLGWAWGGNPCPRPGGGCRSVRPSCTEGHA